MKNILLALFILTFVTACKPAGEEYPTTDCGCGQHETVSHAEALKQDAPVDKYIWDGSQFDTIKEGDRLIITKIDDNGNTYIKLDE